jgi:hypothetical protein
MMNMAWNLYVSRNVVSRSAGGGLRVGNIPRKVKLIMTSKAHAVQLCPSRASSSNS